MDNTTDSSNNRSDNTDTTESNDSNIEDKLNSFLKLTKLSTWIYAFEWTKENVSTLVILITGIGAFIQIIELALIDLSYIRFFSVSQLISDGALVLLVFGTYALMYLFSHKFLIFNQLIKARTRRIDSGETFSFYDKYISFLSTVVTLYIMLKLINFTNLETVNGMLWLVILLLPIATYINFILVRILILNLRYIFSNNDKFKVNTFFRKFNIKPLYIITNIFAILGGTLILVIGLIKFLVIIYLSIRVPYHIDNYNQLNERIVEDYNGLNEYKLLYFNDIYTFVELEKPEDKDKRLIGHTISGTNYKIDFYKNMDKTVVIYKTEDVLF